MHTSGNQSPAQRNRGARPSDPVQAITCLRELKLGYIEFLHDLIPEHVGGRKKPAPPTVLLIGPRAGLEVDYIVEDMLVGNLGCTVQQ